MLCVRTALRLAGGWHDHDLVSPTQSTASPFGNTKKTVRALHRYRRYQLSQVARKKASAAARVRQAKAQHAFKEEQFRVAECVSTWPHPHMALVTLGDACGPRNVGRTLW